MLHCGPVMGDEILSLDGVYVLFFYLFFSRGLAIVFRKHSYNVSTQQPAQSQSASVCSPKSPNSLHATLVPRRSLQLRVESRFDQAKNFRGLGWLHATLLLGTLSWQRDWKLSKRKITRVRTRGTLGSRGCDFLLSLPLYLCRSPRLYCRK